MGELGQCTFHCTPGGSDLREECEVSHPEVRARWEDPATDGFFCPRGYTRCTRYPKMLDYGCNVCANSGNCTLPETCSCELGWSGNSCETALCAQECRNGGKCVAPDQCQCKTWPNSNYEDGSDKPL